MPSSVAWLDVSAEEQRRAREFIALFTQPESRDELGIGQIRDAFSNTLFPGTSVIQTRARYFLYVPWIYLDGQRRGRSGQDLTRWTAARERRLIEVLRTAGTATGDIEGLIGRVAGERLKILPSSIYWNGLITFGILRRDVAAEQLGAEGPRRTSSEADELAERPSSSWSPSIPVPPDGFPERVDTAFVLRPDEARWLAERINQSVAARDSLLAQIIAGHARTVDDSFGPWDDPTGRIGESTLRAQIEHAELFSLGIHGASLLYNCHLGSSEVTSPWRRSSTTARSTCSRVVRPSLVRCCSPNKISAASWAGSPSRLTCPRTGTGDAAARQRSSSSSPPACWRARRSWY